MHIQTNYTFFIHTFLNYRTREEEGIEMQVLGQRDFTDRNEPSTSGMVYHQNEPSNKCASNN